MPPFLTDLETAVVDVLTRHSRLDLRDRLVPAVLTLASEPTDRQALSDLICRLFNAAPVPA